VEELMLLDEELLGLSRFYWWATVAGLTASLLLTTLSAILAALNTAVTPASALSGVPGLYLCNILASKTHFLRRSKTVSLTSEFCSQSRPTSPLSRFGASRSTNLSSTMCSPRRIWTTTGPPMDSPPSDFPSGKNTVLKILNYH